MTYYSKPYGSGWFDCGCEPREIIVCRDDGRSQSEINDGFGFNGGGCGGQGGFGGYGGFGGFGGYNECGWAATQGWTWWEGNNNYCDVPKFVVPDCDDDYLPPLTQQETLNDFNYDPCGCNFDVT